MGSTDSLTTSLLDEMTRCSYGYGRWDAPFWFIGPEPGIHADEHGSLFTRCAAWKSVGGSELVDCKQHHRAMNVTDWHRHPKPRLQPTWRRLIKLLFTYSQLPTNTDEIRTYQRDRFGSSTGETCVVELSALAAQNLKTDRDRTLYRGDRIDVLRERIESHRPEWVVLYGVDRVSRKAWNELLREKIQVGEVRRVFSSRLILIPHPQAHVTDEVWLQNASELMNAVRRC